MKTLQKISLFVALMLNVPVWGQHFEFKATNPFGLELTRPDTSQPALRFVFYDFDNDGDKDAIIAGIDSIDQESQPFTFKNITYFVSMQENIGNRWTPVFKTREAAYPDLLQMTGFVYPAAGDLNGDHKPDFLVCCDADEYLNLGVRYFESKPDGGYKSYSAAQLKLNGFSAGSFFIPEIADMDKDGDNDLLMSGFVRYYGEDGEETDVATMLYAKNTGSATVPHFQGWYQNTNGIASYLFKSAFFLTGDLDLDDDVDLFTIWQEAANDDIFYIGGIFNDPLLNGKANFVTALSFIGLPSQVSDVASIPALVDLDGDRDIDVLMLENMLTDTMRLSYYENTSCTGQIDNKVTKTGQTLKARATGVEYQWINCATGLPIEGATQQVFVPAISGKYAVRLRDNKGCENMSLCEEVVISGTDEELEQNLEVGPVPARANVLIKNKEGIGIDQIQLFTADGKIILKKTDCGISTTVDVSTLTAGAYFLEITINGRRAMKKIMVAP